MVKRHMVAGTSVVCYPVGVGTEPVAPVVAASSSGGHHGRISLREISGQGLAVCDHIELLMAMDSDLWPLNVVFSFQRRRALVREIEGISANFVALMKWARSDHVLPVTGVTI